MLANNLLQKASKSVLITSLRTKVHPTPARFEFVQGKSAVGRPATLSPLRVDIEKGKSYAWCSCGASKRQPFCDGSHKALNLQLGENEPKFAPLRFVCEESRTVYFCNCKSSSNRPFCDGTHSQLAKNSQQNTFNPE